jgi:hypothetical protein
MGDFEYVYVYRSDDEEIQNVLREYPEEQALINAYREARLAAEYRLGNQAFYHRRGDGAQVEQDPAASAPFEPQALASFADETPEANGIGPAATDVGTGSQHYEAGFVDDYDDDDLYADP